MIEKGDFDIDRIVTPKETQAETTDDFEVSLRPKTLDEYIGQEKVKENLKIYIQAAKNRGDSLDHVLLLRPSWSGQDHSFCHNRSRDGSEHQDNLRSCYRKAGRPCSFAHQP